MLAALGLSVIGDITILIHSPENNLLIYGLVAFIFAHLFYIKIFSTHRNISARPSWSVTMLVLLGLGLYLALFPNLDYFEIPMAIYILIIIGMVSLAYTRKKTPNVLSYYMVLLGAILFMISNSILAVTKFHTILPYADFL